MKQESLDNLVPFEKGKSGNPAGRPKGAKNRSTIAKYWLEQSQNMKNPLTLEMEELTQEDLITLSMIKKARKGSEMAYKSLMDSAYGTPTSTQDITSGGEKISFNIQDVLKFGNDQAKSEMEKSLE